MEEPNCLGSHCFSLRLRGLGCDGNGRHDGFMENTCSQRRKKDRMLRVNRMKKLRMIPRILAWVAREMRAPPNSSWEKKKQDKNSRSSISIMFVMCSVPLISRVQTGCAPWRACRIDSIWDRRSLPFPQTGRQLGANPLTQEPVSGTSHPNRSSVLWTV